MAYGDLKDTKTAGSRLSTAFDRARLEAELSAEQDSNIEVGDFLSELATAIRFRAKNGQSQGDWLDEPERLFTDGLMFSVQQAVASEVKLQITVSLDASNSMWVNKIMKHAGPAVVAIDRIIRMAMIDLPQGTVLYQPFIFHRTAHRVPASYLNNYCGTATWKNGDEADRTIWPRSPKQAQIDAAVAAGELKSSADGHFDLSGSDTRIAPLFQAIQAWEQAEGDPNAVRLDIVITDGVLEEEGDVETATKTQEERNGRLRTVLLNFLPLDQWTDYQLPDRCAQFAVDADSLNTSIRDILSEAVNDLFI